MKLVFAAAEVSPIAKTGGLGDVAGSLPKALTKLGHEVVVFMPFYRQARQWFDKNGITPHQMAPSETLRWSGWEAEVTFLRATLPGTEIPLILVANDHFFDRDQIYAARNDGFDDFLHRYTFFCRAVIRGCELLAFAPDVLHCHDWHTALLPVYLHSGLRGHELFGNTRSVYTIHNLNYQGIAGRDAFGILGLHDRYWAPDALEHFGELNPMKGGLIFADQVTTVSPTYAREIQTPEFGAGLDGLLRQLDGKVAGILNGIDVDEWDPGADTFLDSTYTPEKLAGKAANKRALAKEAGLRFHGKRPMLGVVSRLVDQKGFQILLPVLGKLLDAGAQAIILGSGDPRFEDGFLRVGAEYQDQCRVWIGFDNALAHRIYAGCDLLLMPSIYEPCGLNQMYALRYGTLPVARLTGGLADTVIPFDGTNVETANGFGFVSTHPLDLYTATWLGMLNFADSKLWKSLQQNGMKADFSWDRSGREYEEIYQRALTA
ncbi:MAG TPA: glycogen synthase GlgA [Thermoanaerobaculia bacterium]|jgi:starch synthase